MALVAGIVAAAGGRFVPPLTVARSGLGLSAGQFKITDYSATYTYILGGSAGRSGDIINLAPSTSTGTVQAQAPKGVTGSSVVNVGRAPYTYHDSYHHNPNCASAWHGGQCAAWGPPNHHYNGSPLNPGPSGYTGSEGEWWRIW